MNLKQVTLEYDPQVDAAYLKLGRGKVTGSQEVRPGLIVDFDAREQILGVEILRFSQRFVSKVQTPRTKHARRRTETALR